MINIRQFITEKLKVSSTNVSKIDFDKFKDDKFKFTICYHNMPGKKPCCGESVELLKKEIKTKKNEKYKISTDLFK